MSSDKSVNDGRFTTMTVDGETTVQDILVEGNLTVNGTISPYVPGDIDTGNVPLMTLWK